MNIPRPIEWGIAFVIGVASSLFTEGLLIYLKAESFAARAAKWLFQTNGPARLRRLFSRRKFGSDDPQTVVRAEWACDLYELGNANPVRIRKALQSFYFLSDLLEPDDRAVAHEALKRAYAKDGHKDLGKEYLKVLQRFDS